MGLMWLGLGALAELDTSSGVCAHSVLVQGLVAGRL